MAQPDVEKVIGSIREGIAGAGEKSKDVAGEVADRIEDALERAELSGRRIKRKVERELEKRWRQVDHAGRENAFLMAFGALAVGVVIGYLVGRDRR